MARRQLHPRADPLQLPRRVQPRRARARAERRHDPSGPHLRAVPAAIDTSASRSVRRAAERRAATPWPAASRVRALARCTLPRRSSRGARGRARNGATTHKDRLWGRSRRLSTFPARGASVAPRSVVQRPPGAPQSPTACSPAAAPAALAAEAPEAARRSPLLPTTAASSGDPRLFPHLRLTARRTRRRSTCEGSGGVLSYRPVGWQHGCRKTGQLRLRADRRHRPPRLLPVVIPAAINISVSRSVQQAGNVGAEAI